jgi:uncharacterized damage-inducible protein DinB
MSTGTGSHADRVANLRQSYATAHGRFVDRLQRVSVEAAERAPSGGGWSAAQIGWHVAAVDAAFADLISGVRATQPLPDDFRERAWTDVVAEIPSSLQASSAVTPPAGVRRADVLPALEASAQKIDAALEGLTVDRGSRFGLTHRIVGTISLYQVGEWAIAHTIRHNAQAKRVLGE